MDLQHEKNRVLTHLILDKGFRDSLKNSTSDGVKDVINGANVDPPLKASDLDDGFLTKLKTAVDTKDLGSQPIDSIESLKGGVEPAPASW
ncbi:MAG: hypothetical protein ABUK01_03965 [Leptospirales bacterium]